MWTVMEHYHLVSGMLAVALIFLRVTLPFAVAIAAKRRGRDPIRYFIFSLLFGPVLVGCLLVFVLGDWTATLPPKEIRTKLAMVNAVLIPVLLAVALVISLWATGRI